MTNISPMKLRWQRKQIAIAATKEATLALTRLDPHNDNLDPYTQDSLDEATRLLRKALTVTESLAKTWTAPNL